MSWVDWWVELGCGLSCGVGWVCLTWLVVVVGWNFVLFWLDVVVVVGLAQLGKMFNYGGIMFLWVPVLAGCLF